MLLRALQGEHCADSPGRWDDDMGEGSGNVVALSCREFWETLGINRAWGPLC